MRQHADYRGRVGWQGHEEECLPGFCGQLFQGLDSASDEDLWL